jgi:hypothetical protein
MVLVRVLVNGVEEVMAVYGVVRRCFVRSRSLGLWLCLPCLSCLRRFDGTLSLLVLVMGDLILNVLLLILLIIFVLSVALGLPGVDYFF